VHSIYEQGIETAFQLYQRDSSTVYLSDIYHFMENSRYRNLSDNLTGIKAFARARIPENLVGRLREAEYYLKYFSRKKAEIPEKSEYYNQKLFEKTRQRDMLMDSIDRVYPQVASLKSLMNSGTLEALEGKVRTGNGILIQYFSGVNHFYIFSTDGKQSHIQKVDKDSAVVTGIEALLGLPDSDPLSRPAYLRFLVNSHHLYEKLLKPTLEQYPDDQSGSLVIVPDGSLTRISFDALIRSMPDTSYINYRAPDYLVNHYTVSYAFSSGMLVSAAEPAREERKGKVLGLSYGVADSTDGSPVNLVGANRELDIIRGLFRGRFFKDREATESNLKKYAPDYQIIHLALHGKAGIGSNDSTMLIFRKEKGDPDDGLLFPEELYSLNLHARLVVLSSCGSGIGKDFRGEGVYSMARAFANAGCPVLVTTLWQIPDRFTVPLMAEFYGGLEKKLSPGLALRTAKMTYLDKADQYTSHPRFWASFIPMGKVSDGF
jgi:CHAT domain-containing protein